MRGVERRAPPAPGSIDQMAGRGSARQRVARICAGPNSLGNRERVDGVLQHRPAAIATKQSTDAQRKETELPLGRSGGQTGEA